MDRSFAVFLAAVAVVGAVGGTVAAVSLGADGGAGPTASDSRSSSDAAGPGGTGKPGTVFWANQRVLRDGDVEVPLALGSPPTFVLRSAEGWVVGNGLGIEGAVSQVTYVLPDGTSRELAKVDGDVDVSPDGTRLVARRVTDKAGKEQGYDVWDLASGEVVERIDEGSEASQEPSGSAQFVDDTLVATGWGNGDLGGPEVVVAHQPDSPVDGDVLGGGEVYGGWSISPDGRWLAASELDRSGFTCARVISLESGPDSGDGCATRFDGRPSFAADSSAVLGVPADTDGFGPGLLVPVPTGDLPAPATIDAPDATLAGVYLDETRVVLLGARNLNGDGTTINVCEADACEEVYSGGDAAQTAVLGTSY